MTKEKPVSFRISLLVRIGLSKSACISAVNLKGEALFEESNPIELQSVYITHNQYFQELI